MFAIGFQFIYLQDLIIHYSSGSMIMLVHSLAEGCRDYCYRSPFWTELHDM